MEAVLLAHLIGFLLLMLLVMVRQMYLRRVRRREVCKEIAEDRAEVEKTYGLQAFPYTTELTWKTEALNLSEEDWDKLHNEP
jgi:hypothetical protein